MSANFWMRMLGAMHLTVSKTSSLKTDKGLQAVSKLVNRVWMQARDKIGLLIKINLL